MTQKISAVHEEKTQNRHSRIDMGSRNDTNWLAGKINRNTRRLHLWHWPGSLYQMTQEEYKIEPDKIAIKDLIDYSTNTSNRKETCTTTDVTFSGQSRTKQKIRRTSG